MTFGGAVNKTDKYQQNTCLHWAVTSGNNIAVKLLIEAGADLNAINEKVGNSWKGKQLMKR